jgi:hypothetical protein
MQQDIQLASDLWEAMHHWASTADIPAAADFQKMTKTTAVNKQGLQLDTAPAISLRFSRVRLCLFGGIILYIIRKKKEIDAVVAKRYFAIQEEDCSFTGSMLWSVELCSHRRPLDKV